MASADQSQTRQSGQARQGERTCGSELVRPDEQARRAGLAGWAGRARAGGRDRPGYRARQAIAAVSMCGAVILAGCGSSGTSSSPSPAAASPSASPAIPCAQITSLRNSLVDLTHVPASQASAGRISADLSNIRKQLTALKNQATGAFASQASQLSAALETVAKSAGTLASNPSSANLTGLHVALDHLESTAQTLIGEMKAVCPSA